MTLLVPCADGVYAVPPRDSPDFPADPLGPLVRDTCRLVHCTLWGRENQDEVPSRLHSRGGVDIVDGGWSLED